MYKQKLILFVCFISISLFAQQKADVSGIVKIKRMNNVLPYAQVVLDGTTVGTVTNEDGAFQLTDIPYGEYILKVMYTGYKTEHIEFTLKGNSTEKFIIWMEQTPISIEEILVRGVTPLTILSNEYTIGESGNSPNDVGEFFKTILNAGAIKKGGFAMDPVIRGFKQDQLNVQIDGGSRCWGGGPNRMDPPTSHIQSDDLERIEVIKGPFSVRWGQTMGGIINLVMQRPQLSSTFKLNGKLSSGYESNGDSRKERLTLTGGSEKWDFYIGGGEKVFGDYISGGEQIEVPSAFMMRDYSIKFGVNPSDDHRLQLTWRQSFARSVSYPALPMDASIDDTNIFTLDYSGRNVSNIVSSISMKTYYSTVKHAMDNFSRKNFTMVEAETIADAITYGGRFEIGSQIIKGGKLFFGNDYYLHSKDGDRSRFVKINPCNTKMHPNKIFTDGVWQNSSISNYGIFGEYHQILSDKMTVNCGIRLDMTSANIGEPSEQFVAAYGANKDFSDQNLSFMGMLKYSASPAISSTISFGRGTRAPDITERFINHLPIGKSPHEHFGNPNLKSEVNDQIELALSGIMKDQLISFNVFYSNLSNYILAKVDSSNTRLYMPCDEPKYTKVFGNVKNAYQYGYELQVEGNIINNLRYNASLAFLFGHNQDIDEPLPEIAPLTANISFQYSPANIKGWLELNGRIVSAQNRISTVYGESKTDGYSIFGIVSGYTFKNILFRIEIQNLFDTMYYDHLSRNFSKNTVEAGIPLYEQGRNVTFNVEIKI
ncbi:MAG: TonB-dependent receptor [Planctomycetia bacterium]|nr:TonB-dependent receptor [Planctomycetia bacterium]